jgi:hypothetical protein
LFAGDVHGLTEAPSANIPDERLDVYYCVFASVDFCLVCSEHDVGRVESEVVELTGDGLGHELICQV